MFVSTRRTDPSSETAKGRHRKKMKTQHTQHQQTKLHKNGIENKKKRGREYESGRRRYEEKKEEG